MIHAVCVTMTHANDDVIMQFKKYQFLYLPETTFLTRLLKAAPLSCFFELGSCGLSGPKILILVKVKFFFQKFRKMRSKFQKNLKFSIKMAMRDEQSCKLIFGQIFDDFLKILNFWKILYFWKILNFWKKFWKFRRKFRDAKLKSFFAKLPKLEFESRRCAAIIELDNFRNFLPLDGVCADDSFVWLMTVSLLAVRASFGSEWSRGVQVAWSCGWRSPDKLTGSGPEVFGELGISATDDNLDGLSLLVCNAGGRLLDDRALKMLRRVSF